MCNRIILFKIVRKKSNSSVFSTKNKIIYYPYVPEIIPLHSNYSVFN